MEVEDPGPSGVIISDGTVVFPLAGVGSDAQAANRERRLDEYTTMLDRNAVSQVVLLADARGEGSITDGFETQVIQRAVDAGVPEIRLVIDDDEHVLAALNSPPGPSPSGLSEKQRAVIVRAYELGYFDVPREATLGDLAEEFDISKQALSERLRRGMHHLADEVSPITDD